jgi:transposase
MVSVVNPTRIKHYGERKLQRNKKDKADADLFSEFCLKETPDTWKPFSPEIKHLRALIRCLQALKNNRRQEDNRLKCGVKDDWVINDLKTHLKYLDERIKVTEKRN